MKSKIVNMFTIWISIINEVLIYVCCCKESKEQKLDEIIAKYKDTRGALIPFCMSTGNIRLSAYGCSERIAEGLHVSLADVYGALLSTQFHWNKGKYKINVCMEPHALWIR